VYKALPPQPDDGHWTGYYLELFFPADTEKPEPNDFKNEFHYTTPGWTMPNTLPFADCHNATCLNNMV